MGAECSKCGHDIIDACECEQEREFEAARKRGDLIEASSMDEVVRGLTDTRHCSECLRLTEDLERQKALTKAWVAEAQRLRPLHTPRQVTRGRAMSDTIQRWECPECGFDSPFKSHHTKPTSTWGCPDDKTII